MAQKKSEQISSGSTVEQVPEKLEHVCTGNLVTLARACCRYSWRMVTRLAVVQVWRTFVCGTFEIAFRLLEKAMLISVISFGIRHPTQTRWRNIRQTDRSSHL